MEFNRCSRCGSFYVSAGNVCPKCSAKDGVEFSNFLNYVEENGLNDSLDTCKKYFENFNFISKNESNLKEKVNEYEKNKMDMDKILGKQI